MGKVCVISQYYNHLIQIVDNSLFNKLKVLKALNFKNQIVYSSKRLIFKFCIIRSNFRDYSYLNCLFS